MKTCTIVLNAIFFGAAVAFTYGIISIGWDPKYLAGKNSHTQAEWDQINKGWDEREEIFQRKIHNIIGPLNQFEWIDCYGVVVSSVGNKPTIVRIVITVIVFGGAIFWLRRAYDHPC